MLLVTCLVTCLVVCLVNMTHNQEDSNVSDANVAKRL